MANLFWDFCNFASAVICQWFNLVAAITGSAIWFFYERQTGKAVPMKVVYWVVGVCLFWAFFTAWRDQYQKAKGGFVGMVFQEAWASRQNSVVYVPSVRVYNGGPAASKLEGFKLTLRAGGREWKNLKWTYWPQLPVTEFRNPVTGRTFHLAESSMLYSKVEKKRLDPGDWDSGYVVYVLDGISDPPEQFDGEITFTDAFRRTYNIPISSKQPHTNELLYTPDLENPFQDSMQPSPDPNSSPN